MNFWKPFLPYTGKISLLHWLVLYPFIVCSVRLALRKPWEKTQFWRPWCVCLSCVCVWTVLRTRVAGLIFQGDSYKLGPRTQSRNALRKGSVSIHGTLLQQDELGARGSPCDLVFQQEQRGLAPPQHVRQSLLPIFPMFIHLATLASVFFYFNIGNKHFPQDFAMYILLLGTHVN